MKDFAYLITAVVLCFIFPKNIYAYIDPGSGSCFLQIIVCILLAGLFSIKLFLNKIKAFFLHLFRGKKNDSNPA